MMVYVLGKLCYDGSEDVLAIKPLFLISAFADVQLRVIHRLQIPLPVPLAEQSLHRELVEVDHLVIQKGGMLGLRELGLRAHVPVGPGDYVLQPEDLGVVVSCAQGDYPEGFVVGVESEGSVEISLGVEAALLSGRECTLVRRVGSSCLYLRADSLLLKMSANVYAEWYRGYR